MKTKAGDRRRSAGGRSQPPGERTGVDPALWVTWSESAMLEGMRWFDVWLQGTQRFWSAGLRAFGPLGSVSGAGNPGSPGKDGLRRTSDVPWVPQLEAQVIPLRRKTDEPGSQATRISMRLPMPWSVGGADVISLEAIVGRRPAAVSEPEGEDIDAPERGKQR